MPTKSSRANANGSSSRQRIIDYLTAQGGRIASPDGRGLTAALASAAGYGDLGVLNAMLSRLESEGVIQRDIRGRRTFAITLARRSGGATATPRAASTATAAPARKTTGKKATAKKASAKKATAKKSAAKKSTAKKAASKATGKRAGASTAKRSTAKKATGGKKAAVKKTAAKKSTAKAAGRPRGATKKR